MARAGGPAPDRPGFSIIVPGGDTLEALAAEIRACRACPLAGKRKNAVPGEGSARSGIVFVGEAPGAKEDARGRPFVGSAGKLLARLLKKNGLAREEVFITNTVKCRPPGNRPPKSSEMEACRPFLAKQLGLLRPKLVCTLGNSPLHALVDRKLNITREHGRPREAGGFWFLPLYHPAAILYRRRLMADLERDFEMIGRMGRSGKGTIDRWGGEEE
ncbi:MAG: uracil-DNA glycosylase [Euryarchaeota archaeon]|nr:uracil-DNA glycosylase [Euryarchaeota archaeon]